MKYFYSTIIFLISLITFIILDNGRITLFFNELLQPLVFSFTVVAIFLFRKSRKAALSISLLMFILMVGFYLLDFLPEANLLGSLGIGIFVILIFSYFPELIKNGHI